MGPSKVWQSLESKIHQIVDGTLSRAAKQASSHPLEAYNFDHFDLNGDGIVTREVFEEARRKILAGAGQAAAPVRSSGATAAAACKFENDPVKEKAPQAYMRHLYCQAARRLRALARGQDYEAARCVVRHLLRTGMQRLRPGACCFTFAFALPNP